MGNCLACFRDRNRRNRSDFEGSCKYQQATSLHHHQQQQPNHPHTKDNVLQNNNYSLAIPVSGQVQSELRLTNRDVLDHAELQGLLRPEHTSSKTTSTATTNASSSGNSSNTAYGLKLLMKGPKPAPVGGQISDNKINALFEAYRDDVCEDAILAPGIERLCADLRYKPEDFAVLVLAWRLDAAQMCRFTKAEFIQGLHTLNADSIDGVRQRLEEEVQRLAQDRELFKNLYRFTFRFGLEPDLRTLPLDMAISLWQLVFTVHTPEVLAAWLAYLEENPNQVRGIPKDTWNMFLNFAENCDINSYSDEDAWPSVFDDFVEYQRGTATALAPSSSSS